MAKEFDLEAVTAELDKEFSQEEATETEEEVAEPETQVQEDTPEPEAEEGEEEAEEEGEAEEPVIDPDVHKRNEAFKRLREERDRLAKSDQFLETLASEYGMSKEQLIDKYTEQLHEKQAKDQGMTKEQFKKMQEMENRMFEIEEEKKRQSFNIYANEIANSYELSDDQMMELFDYARQINVDIIENPALLDFVYRAVNYENAIEKGRQKQLETSKKRKSTSTGKTGTSGLQAQYTEEDMQKEIEGFLKEQGIMK